MNTDSAIEMELTDVNVHDDAGEESDEALIDAYQRGNQDAFAVLVERYASPLLGYLTRMAGDRGRAQDLVQETFLRVHKRAWQFHKNGTFRAWMYKIGTRLALDEFRRRKRRPVTMPLNESIDRADAGLNPRTTASVHERRELVRKAVTGLPPRQRAVLVLAYYEGLNYPEIGVVLKCSVGTVKTHMSRALHSLGRRLPDPGTM